MYYSLTAKIFVIILSLSVFLSLAEEKIIYERQSQYQKIRVVEKKEALCMQFDFVQGHRLNQGCKNKNSDKIELTYAKQILTSYAIYPEAKSVLVVGLGIGTIPIILKKISNAKKIDVVEIDPLVNEVAMKYFDYSDDEIIHTFISDGRYFIKEKLKLKEKYDLIILDAFNGEYIPEHMLTVDFLNEVKGLMSESSLLVANTFGRSILYEYESSTYAKVFNTFYQSKHDNRIIFAMKKTSRLMDNFEKAHNVAEKFDLKSKIEGFSMVEQLNKITNFKQEKIDKKMILTDQFSPANLISKLRKQEIEQLVSKTSSHKKNNEIVDFTLQFKRENPLMFMVFLVSLIFLLQVLFVAFSKK